MNSKAMIVLAVAIVSVAGCILVVSDDSDAATGDVTMNGTQYDSINSAITAAIGSPVTITLNNDVSENVVISSDVTIDLNGHDLTNSTSNTIVVQDDGVLTITGTGSISNAVGSSSSCININAGGKLIVSEDADITLKTQVVNKGHMEIHGTVTQKEDTGATSDDSPSIRTDSGAALYVYGEVISEAGNIRNNNGTVYLDAHCEILKASFSGTMTFISDENEGLVHYVNISQQDNVDLDGAALHAAMFKGANVYNPNLTVIVTLEGSADSQDPYVYGLSTTSGDRIRANMIIQSEDGTFAEIDLSGGSQKQNAVNITGYGAVSEFTMRNIDLTAGTSNQVRLNFGVFPDFTFENCTFTNIYLAQSSGTSGTTVFRGCDIINTGDRIGAYGLTINSGTVVVENCKIDSYLSGVNINTSSSSNHSITVSGNVISNLGSNGDSGEAIQIAGSLEGKQVLITGNGIDNANVALQIYHNCGEAAEAFAISDNAITSTPVGINYEADETNAPSRVSVIANGNYFAPDGSRGVAMTVTSDVTTDVADQVVCDVYYTDASMDSTNEDTAPPWIWDDDDDYVPPIVPAQPSESGDDNTTTIVACAAAAVVAALMAAFLILDRKR